VLAIGFLLLVSLAASAALAGLGAWMRARMAGADALVVAVDWALSLAVTAGLFALLFKVLPDVTLTWRDVAIGGVVTALLFTVGKYAIGAYLGGSSTASSYGAIGSVLVLLLWVYYSAQILLIGAEFTRLYTEATTGERRAPTPRGRRR
jgi:membrane protein